MPMMTKRAILDWRKDLIGQYRNLKRYKMLSHISEITKEIEVLNCVLGYDGNNFRIY